jgi:hypothetical protein
MILAEVHDGIAGGHYAGKETTQNILRRTMVAHVT